MSLEHNSGVSAPDSQGVDEAEMGTLRSILYSANAQEALIKTLAD